MPASVAGALTRGVTARLAPAPTARQFTQRGRTALKRAHILRPVRPQRGAIVVTALLVFRAVLGDALVAALPASAWRSRLYRERSHHNISQRTKHSRLACAVRCWRERLGGEGRFRVGGDGRSDHGAAMMLEWRCTAPRIDKRCASLRRGMRRRAHSRRSAGFLPRNRPRGRVGALGWR